MGADDAQRRTSSVAAATAKFEKRSSQMPAGQGPLYGASMSDLSYGNNSSGSVAFSNSSGSIDFDTNGETSSSPATPKKNRVRPNLPPHFISPGAVGEPSEAEKKKKRPFKSKSMPRPPLKVGGSMGLGLSSPMTSDGVPVWKRKLLEKQKSGVINYKESLDKRASFMPQLSQFDSDDDLDSGDIDESSPVTSSSKKKVVDEKIEDVKIDAKINPQIQEKLRQRQRQNWQPKKSVSAFSYSSLAKTSDDSHVPEHILRFREREAARKLALDRKARAAEQKIQAVVLGWYRRLQYPKLKAAYRDKLRQIAEKQRVEKERNDSAVVIQAIVRRYPARKNFRRHWASIQKRLQTLKRIKEMEEKAKLIPEQTKAEIEKMKKEYHDKNSNFHRAMMQRVKSDMKNHEKKMEEIKKAGKTETEYIKQENRRIRDEMSVIAKDMQLLHKQAKVLESKSAETQERFKSLEKWCKKKAESNQKKKIAEEKCRHRYLPKYRRDVAGKNQECITENRVKEICKKVIYKIVHEMQARSSDPNVTSEVVSMILATEQELEETLGDYDPPEQLEKWLGW